MAIGSKFRGGSNSSNDGEERAEEQQAAAQGEKESGDKDIGSFLWPFYVIGMVVLIAVAVSTIYNISLFAVVQVAVAKMVAHLGLYLILLYVGEVTCHPLPFLPSMTSKDMFQMFRPSSPEHGNIITQTLKTCYRYMPLLLLMPRRMEQWRLDHAPSTCLCASRNTLTYSVVTSYLINA